LKSIDECITFDLHGKAIALCNSVLSDLLLSSFNEDGTATANLIRIIEFKSQIASSMLENSVNLNGQKLLPIASTSSAEDLRDIKRIILKEIDTNVEDEKYGVALGSCGKALTFVATNLKLNNNTTENFITGIYTKALTITALISHKVALKKEISQLEKESEKKYKYNWSL
jgi:hypothetical protein